MLDQINRLPTLGVGASLSLSAKPDPVLLVKNSDGPAFVEYAGLVDVDSVIEEITSIRDAGADILFHPSYINFCGSWKNSDKWLTATARHIEHVQSPWFAQDLAYCFWQDGPGYSSQYGYFIPPILNKTSLQKAIERVQEVQAIVPVTVAIEPPPVSFVAGTILVFEFFGEIANQTDCAILLDMGHLVSYEMASGHAVMEAIDKLPHERVIEIHIAGGKIRESQLGPIYVDAHESTIQDETWAMLEKMLPQLTNVKAVCYECEGVSEKTVLLTLKRIRNIVSQKSASSNLVKMVNTST